MTDGEEACLRLIIFQGCLRPGHELRRLWFISLPGMRPFQRFVKLPNLCVNEVKLTVLKATYFKKVGVSLKLYAISG